MKFKTGCHKCFSALSTEARVEIVKLLQKSPRLSVLEIVGHFSLTQPTISHHLKYLEKSGILISKKEGRRVYYCLSPLCGKNECKIF
ncbi:MAG: metalloregulator ArsR/SmtB family transcription factor [Candidatus Daviesbacteria bacterium]|nr:metalloregulator ArsR/SmtB family transcription factor [Candidatus Daviesbacteria bacterium]